MPSSILILIITIEVFMNVTEDDRKTLLFYVERLQKAERNANIAMIIWSITAVAQLVEIGYRLFIM